jgi:hypothetical protein
MTQTGWHDVPPEHQAAWLAIFMASQEILTLAAPCPVCGAVALHRWYYVGSTVEDIPGIVARGGLWQWCSACHCFEHYSALVPEWWACDLQVDTKGLTPYPTKIEEAMGASERKSDGMTTE